MGHATRNAVFTALFEYLKSHVTPPTGNSWKTASQHLVQWDDVNHAQQPAIFLHRGPQIATQTHAFGVTKWVWKATVWVYFRTDGLKTTSTYPSQLTDQFLDNLEFAFQTEPLVGRFTLGDLVEHCWIDGGCFADSGLIDGQAVIVIPLSILV